MATASHAVQARPVRTYRELFGIGEFRVLFTTTSLNVGAGSVGSLALGTLTYAETGSPLLSAFVMFGGPLVRLATSWFLLSLADLWRPRTAMMLAAGVMAVGDAVQAIPDLPMTARLVLLVVPWVLLSATGGSMIALVSEVVPEGSFVFARATINIAVGVMQIVGFGLGGLLLLTFTTSQLFLGAAAACLVALVLVRLGSATTRRARPVPPSAAAGRSTGCCSAPPPCARSTWRCGCPTAWSSAARR